MNWESIGQPLLVWGAQIGFKIRRAAHSVESFTQVRSRRSGVVAIALSRLGLNNPPTAVGGIRLNFRTAPLVACRIQLR